MLEKAYQTISFDSKKCNGCNKCVEACAIVKSNSSDLVHSRIQILKDDQTGEYKTILCRQCADPQCVKTCPAKALSKNEETGVVEWDSTKCVGCLLCTLACPYAGISFNIKTNEVMKCDLCGGDPECVKACEPRALKFRNEATLYNKYGELEDLYVSGLSACLGCNAELLIRHTLRYLGPETVVATPPGCIGGVGGVGVNGKTGTKVPSFFPLLTNIASMLAGARRYYNRIGRDVTMLALAGDGGTVDVGFQSLSGAAERNEQMIYICIDNEGYMNTGVQRSGSTPYGSWTTTTPVGTVLRGKSSDAKPLPMIMIMHNCQYVATATMAYLDDYYRKLEKAYQASKKGMAYLHIFSPCQTGWRFPPNTLIEVERKAVETNMFPLWEYSHEKRSLRFTYPVDNPLPVYEYLKLVGKYKHLDEAQINHIQETTNNNIELLHKYIREDGVQSDQARTGDRELVSNY